MRSISSQRKPRLVLAGLAGAMAAVALLGWFLLQVAVESRLDLAVLEAELSRALRLRVEVADLRVDSAGTFLLEGVRARDAAGREVLFAPRSEARIPPWQALLNRPTLKELVLEGPRLTLDSERLKSLPRGEGGGMPFPVEFRRGTVAWRDQGRSWTLTGVDGRIAAAPPGEPVEVEGTAPGLESVRARVSPGPGGWETEARIQGFRETLLRRLAGLPPPPPGKRSAPAGASTAGGVGTGRSDASPGAPEAGETGAPVAEPAVDADLRVSRSGEATTVQARLRSRTSWLEGPLELQATSPRSPVWEGVVTSSGALASGLEVRSVRIPFTWTPDALQLREARVTLPQGTLAVQGTFGPQGFAGRLSSEALQVFPASVQASPARLQAVVKESRALRAQLEWEKVGRLGPAWLRAAGTWKDGGLKLSRAEAGRGEARLAVARVDQPSGRPAEVRIEEAAGGELLGLLPQARGLEPRGFPARGHLRWNPETGGVAVRLQAGEGRLAGQAVQSLDVEFGRASSGRAWAVHGQARALGRRLSLEGRVEPDGRPDLRMEGRGLALQALPSAGRALPGWTGRVDATLDLGPESSRLHVAAHGLSRSGRKVPDLTADLTRTGSRVQVAGGSLALDPPVPFSGEVDLDRRTLSLEGRLQKQSLKALAALAPGLPQGVDGRLEGTLRLQGPLKAPSLRFEGKGTSLALPGLKVPEATLRLDGSRLEARVDSLPLEDVAALPGLGGTARVTLTSKDLVRGLRADVLAPALTWQGQKVGEVKAALSWEDPRVRVEGLVLPLRPPLRLAGSYHLKDRRLDLKGTLKGQDLAALRPFLSAPLAGTLSGDLTLRGPASRPVVEVQGRGSRLAYGDQALGDAAVRLRMATNGEGTVELAGLRAEATQAVAGLAGDLDATALLTPGKDPRLSLRLTEATYRQRKLPPVQAGLSMGSGVLAVHSLRLDLDPPLVATGTLRPANRAFDLTANLAGTRLEDLLALAPAGGLPALQGRLQGPLRLSGDPSALVARFEGKADALAMGGLSLGSGQVAATVDSRTARVRGSGFDPGRLEPLAARYPGLRGAMSFEADRQAEATAFHVAVRQATMTAGPVPDLDGNFTLRGTILTVDRLQAALSPPLTLAGHYDLKGGGIDLNGTLQGQSLGDLIRLSGGRPPAEVSGRLEGPVRISGPTYNPAVDFEGRVAGLTMKGAALGDGQLKVTVGKNLDGRLALERAVPLSAVGGLGGGLGGFLQGVLDATGIQVTGATLAGTPGDPRITPIFSGVSGGRRLQLPGGLNIGLPGR